MHRVVLLLAFASSGMSQVRGIFRRLQRAHVERHKRHVYSLLLTAWSRSLTRGREVRLQRECARSIKRIFTQASLSATAYCTMAQTHMHTLISNGGRGSCTSRERQREDGLYVVLLNVCEIVYSGIGGESSLRRDARKSSRRWHASRLNSWIYGSSYTDKL